MHTVRRWTFSGMAFAAMVVCAAGAADNSCGMLRAALGGECDDGLCSPCDPVGTWQVRAEALFLTRNRAESIPFTALADEGFFGDVTLLQSTKDLGFDYEPGVRLSLTRQLDACNALELAYFGLQEFSSSSSRTSEFGELLSPFSYFDPFFGATSGFDWAHLHSLEYGSDIHNAEVNVRHQALKGCRIESSWLVGFRYVRITEDFALESLELGGGFGGADAIGIHRIGTENDLIGAQLGYELVFAATDRLSLGAKGNAALFLNVADQESTFIQEMGPGLINRVDYGCADEALAGLVEVGLFASYQVGSCVTLRAGYDVLVFSGLALAPEQFDVNIGYFGSALNDGGTAVYHGPSAGVTVVW